MVLYTAIQGVGPAELYLLCGSTRVENNYTIRLPGIIISMYSRTLFKQGKCIALHYSNHPALKQAESRGSGFLTRQQHPASFLTCGAGFLTSVGAQR